MTGTSCEVHVLELGHAPEAVQLLKQIRADEDCLVTECEEKLARTPVGEPAGDAEQRGVAVESPFKASHGVTLVQCGSDVFKGISWKQGIGVQK